MFRLRVKGQNNRTCIYNDSDIEGICIDMLLSHLFDISDNI